MTNMERIRNFMVACFDGDDRDLRELSVKEASTNVLLGITMIVGVALNLVLTLLQLGGSLWLVLYDLIIKGLKKVMPAPAPESEK